MKKKFTILFIGIFLATLLLPSFSSAGHYTAQPVDADGNPAVDAHGHLIGDSDIHYKGLVPCGKDPDTRAPGESPGVAMPCQICHFFVMIDGIVDFLLVPCESNHGMPLIPLIAIVMIVIAGIMFYLGGSSDIAGAIGNPGMVEQAKMILRTVVIGLIVIYGSWLVVDAFMSVVGVAKWTGLKGGWWSIKCKITYNPDLIPPTTPTSSSLQVPINQSAVKSIPINQTFSSDTTIINF